MSKHSPVEKHPDGKGNKAGGGLCGACNGSCGKYVPQVEIRNGKPTKIDVWKSCPACGGSGRK